MERQTTSIIILLWDYSETALATTKQCTRPTPDLLNTQTTPLFLRLLQDYFETTPSPILWLLPDYFILYKPMHQARPVAVPYAWRECMQFIAFPKICLSSSHNFAVLVLVWHFRILILPCDVINVTFFMPSINYFLLELGWQQMYVCNSETKTEAESTL